MAKQQIGVLKWLRKGTIQGPMERIQAVQMAWCALVVFGQKGRVKQV